MKSLSKKISIFILLSIIVFIAIVLYNQKQIMNPVRRVLQAYHYEWLEHPSEHNLKIIKDNKYPHILIVIHDANVTLSKRSRAIKEQLNSIGFDDAQLKNNGIIVMFHGKNGRKEDLLPVAERYVTAGFVCVLVDLPAHGENMKERYAYAQSDERFIYDETLAVVKNYIVLNGKPIYLWGMSLGGAYAIASALPEKRGLLEPKALILVSTFDKLSYVLEEKSVNIFGTYLGEAFYKSLLLSLKLFYDFDPEKSDSTASANSLTLPLFMLHGKKDELIGYEHGEKLFKSFSSTEKEFHLDENGDHHNILITDYPFYLKSIEFLLKQNFRRSYAGK